MTGDDRPLLDEQIAYYRARAPHYYADLAAVPGNAELEETVGRFPLAGDVLELACGPGTWTGLLLRHATTVHAVDASPEMLALARERVADARVRFELADLFDWRPRRRYDGVFFGFWLSHVPTARFDAFWSVVADCLRPGGRVLFVDDSDRTPDELVEGPASSTIERRLPDGTPYRAVKVPYDPRDLEARLAGLGWDITVRSTTGPFFWGAGARSG